jgi:hypothetical protein
MKMCIVAVLLSVSLLVVGCGNGQSTSTAELEAYVDEAFPVFERHAVTTETTNEANRAFFAAYYSGNQAETVRTLTAYRDTLAWALNRVDSELLDFKQLSPPPDGRTLHNLVIDGFQKEQYGLTKALSYYSSVLNYGFGDGAELNESNDLLMEAQDIWQQATSELQDLQDKIEK